MGWARATSCARIGISVVNMADSPKGLCSADGRRRRTEGRALEREVALGSLESGWHGGEHLGKLTVLTALPFTLSQRQIPLELELQMVVDCHVDAGNWTPVL